MNDLEEIEDYIAEDNPVAAYELVLAIYQKTEMVLGEFPYAGRPGRVDGTREFAVPGTAYVVAYQVRLDRVEVLAVLRGERLWPERF